MKKNAPLATANYVTIDEKHTEIINRLNYEEDVILPELLEQKQQLKSRLKCLKNIDERIACSDELTQVREQIQKIKGEKKRYLLNNCADLFSYFEERKNISDGTSRKQNIDKVRSFFKLNADETTTATTDEQKEENPRFINIYKNYWKNNDGTGLFNLADFIIPSGICTDCSGELVVHEEDGVVMCKKCCKINELIIDNSKPSNKDVPNEISYTAYIRLNHYKEILSQFQAKETTQIPPDVLDAIKRRIKKERLNPAEIDNAKMREILRRIKLNKYFEHIQYISSLLGNQPPTMDEVLIETLCVLFIEIQEPWALFCPPNRTNFFNYTYILYQSCVLLGQTQYLPFIPMLKDINKQKEQDMIWKDITRFKGWKYIPTV